MRSTQQNIRGQIRGDEIRDRNFCMLWVEKGWAEKHRQEASKADYDRDIKKKGGGGGKERKIRQTC